MEAVYYTRELNRNYMCIPSDDSNCNYQMNMLINNKIPGIINVSVRSINNSTIYFYDITSLSDFNTYYSKDMLTGEDIKGIINGINSILTAASQYLLNINNFVIDCEYIYSNINTKEIVFCYCDGYDCEFIRQIRMLFEYLMQKISHNDECAVILTYGVYRRICSGETDMKKIFSFEEINECQAESTPVIEEKETINEDVLPEIHNEEMEVLNRNKLFAVCGAEVILGLWVGLLLLGAVVDQIDIVNGNSIVRLIMIVMLLCFMGYIGKWYLDNKNLLFENVTVEKVIPYTNKQISINVPELTTTADSANMTVLLSEKDQDRPMSLKWNDCGEYMSYSIKELPFVIGTLSDKADCIIDLPGVSRIHARISGQMNELYIKDLNSTNGTFVDGRRLACYEICKIDDKSEILLGNTSIRIV